MPTDPWELAPSSTFVGASGATWSIDEPIGEGGTAVVYGVHDEHGRHGAAKMLSGHRFPVTKDMEARFRREIEHLSAINHPCVLAVLDDGYVYDAAVLVTERMHTTLYEVLRTERHQPIERCLVWLAQIASGVQTLHRHHLVHRDLSVKNLLLRADGSIAVGDFGTVRHLDDLTVTQGEGLGSLLYISPQQYHDAHQARPADDVYSLGQIAWHIVTGIPPQGNVPPARHERDDVPEALSDVIEQMRQYDQSRRTSLGSFLTVVVNLLAEPVEVALGRDVATATLVAQMISGQLAVRASDLHRKISDLPAAVEDDEPVSLVAARRAMEEDLVEVHRALTNAQPLTESAWRGGADDPLRVYCENCPYQGIGFPSGQLPVCPNCGRDALEELAVYPSDALHGWGSSAVLDVAFRTGPTGSLEPLLDFTIERDNNARIVGVGLVDTGADFSVLPLAYLELLGLTHADCTAHPHDGPSGQGRILVPNATMRITVLGVAFEIQPKFADTPVTLLGRNDVLMHFEVNIDPRRSILRIKPHRAD